MQTRPPPQQRPGQGMKHSPCPQARIGNQALQDTSRAWVGCAPRLAATCPPAQPPARASAHAPAELVSLRQHRDWADRRIAQLIKRVSDAERPVRKEAARLLQEVQALRVGACPAGTRRVATTAADHLAANELQ